MYGFDNGFRYQLGTKDNGGTLFEDKLGIDDNRWFDPTMENPDTSTG